MPDIDVTDLLLDPDFVEALTILRRTAVVGSNGRQTITEVEVDPKPWGSVQPVDTAIGGNALERAPDAQYRGSAWLVHTEFRLQGPSKDPERQPDVVVIEGDRCVVTIVNSFSKYGAGFIMAEVSSMDPTDNPPT